MKRRLLLVTGALLLCGVALLFIYHHDVARLLAAGEGLLQSSDRLRAALLARGALAPLLLVGLQVVQVIIFPLPGEATGFLGGYLFGAWGGLFYSTVGLALGSWLAFGISRLFRQAVEQRLAHTEAYRRFNHLVAKGDFAIPFLLFFLPGFPKDSLSYVLGLSRMPWRAFLVIAAIGRIPGTLLLSLEGAQIYERNYLNLLLLLGASLVLGLPFYLGRHRLLAWLEGIGRRRANEVTPVSAEEPPP